MGSPYRSGRGTAPDEPVRNTGIVGDLIRQFSDPLAFYRELVQNALDAGTPSVHVALFYLPDEGEMRVSVQDHGEGMGREILEERLVVLFRSTKEGQEGKIGKFGVGFISVLAVEPRLVAVRTACEGRRWELHLHPDHRYDLFDQGVARETGTTVTLHIPMPADRAEPFIHASQAALHRWCCHTQVPVTFRAHIGDDPRPLIDARIDEPLGLDALAAVRATSSDGETTAVVGLPRDGRPYAGFFNHGLTLFETDEPLAGPIAFKVQDSRLGHTLSRDNVRRDGAFARAVGFVQQVAAGDMLRRLERELALAAEAGSRERYTELVLGVVSADVSLRPASFAVPLLHPYQGRPHASAALLGQSAPYAGRRASPVTAALAEAGHPVVDLAAAGDDTQRRGSYVALLRRHGVPEPVVADQRLVLIERVDGEPSDLLLLDRMTAHIADVDRRPSAVQLAELHGAVDGPLFVAGSRSTAPRDVLTVEEAAVSPFRMMVRPPLVLSVEHPAVQAARVLAGEEPDAAAALLARAVLLAAGRMNPARSEELTVDGLARLLEGAR